MEKIRVGMIFHGEYPPHPRIENQALHLIKNNTDVFLFCVTYQKNKASSTIYKGINVERAYYPPLVYRLSALAYTLPFYHWILRKKINNFIKKNKVEYLHVHNIFVAQTVFNLNKKFRLPLILDIHENVPEIMKHYPHLKTRIGKILIKPNQWKVKEGEFITKANQLIVVTEDARDEIIHRTPILGDRVKVLPNFTDATFLKETYDEDIATRFITKFKVVYIGDTGQRRGLTSVIKSVKYLKHSIPDLAIIIVGKSKDDAELKRLISEEDTGSYVFMEGWKEENLLADYVHIADIGICPILRNPHHDTTYANKLFQYAMHGKAILASDCPSQAKLITNHQWGLIHKAGDSKDFADKLLFLYNNKESRVQLGNNGRKSIETKYNFNSSNFNQAFYKNLDKLI